MERKLTDFLNASPRKDNGLTREELAKFDERIEGYLRELGY